MYTISSIYKLHGKISERLATFKHLKGGVEFLSVIPKSPSGKILRRQLRDRVKQSKL